MANLEHLKILKEGVNAWFDWRLQNPGIIPDLKGATFGPAYLRRANLRGANLAEADLHAADLQAADLGGAILNAANLRGACLDGADLSGADLTVASLTKAALIETNLQGANLSGADLRGTDLSGANLDNADFTRARAGFIVFADIDLSGVKGLATVQHSGPSTIGIDTIYKSRGNIPEAFLRGAGVPEDFITHTKSLVGKAIDFQSCLISYSSKDDGFAQRLHTDLQQQGVRCWIAPEDLKVGDTFQTRFEESIHGYDKLMVILSENSIGSPWVEEEVEAALENERKQNRLVLFPIRLDDAIMRTDQAWAATLRHARHIGDFRAWKDHDLYQKSFERLLHDLKM
jgi:uncharacterized protein YjbI with pentapeptide repeats